MGNELSREIDLRHEREQIRAYELVKAKYEAQVMQEKIRGSVKISITFMSKN